MKWIKGQIELLAWCFALFIPVFINPYDAGHFSLCFFKHIGVTWCPGCGLGHSVAYLYRAEWLLSVQTHWLGIPAVVFLIHRIMQLLHRQQKNITINQKII